MTRIVFIALMLFSVRGFAGGEWYEKGNGGFALQCPEAADQTLDLFELADRYALQMTLDDAHLGSVKERVEYLISKIDRLNPTRAQKYREWYKVYGDEAEYFPNIQFDRLGDLGLVRIPDDCKLSQVIFQREPGLLNKGRYTVNERLWNRLKVIDQAALVMHELIYREFASSPNLHQTSERSRYFNALVNSKELLTMSLEKYLGVLQELRVASGGSNQLNATWTPQWAGLAAYWPMSGPAGQIGGGGILPDYLEKSSGVASGPGLFYSGETGKEGIAFDGGNYFVVPNNVPANVCKAMTWMTWVKWSAPENSTYATLITNWNGCTQDPSWNVNQNKSTKHVEMTFNTSIKFNQWVASIAQPLDGKWHHLAVTLSDKGLATMYVDGVRDVTLKVEMGGGICSPSAVMKIGGGDCAAPMGNGGRMSEMAIWNSTLSSQEISNVYNRQKLSF